MRVYFTKTHMTQWQEAVAQANAHPFSTNDMIDQHPAWQAAMNHAIALTFGWLTLLPSSIAQLPPDLQSVVAKLEVTPDPNASYIDSANQAYERVTVIAAVVSWMFLRHMPQPAVEFRRDRVSVYMFPMLYWANRVEDAVREYQYDITRRLRMYRQASNEPLSFGGWLEYDPSVR